MASGDRTEVLLELERRGMLPDEDRTLLQELRRRNLLVEGEGERPAQLAVEEMVPPGERLQAGIEFGAPAVGATVGGIVGQRYGGPPGGVVGAATGGGAGQALAEITRPLITGRLSSVEESLGRNVKEAAFAAGAEVVGQGLVRGAQKVLAPFKQSVLPEAVEAQRALTRVGGGQLTPAQMTENRTLDILEGLTESSFLGGGRLEGLHKKTAAEGVEKLTQEFIDQVGTTLGPSAVAGALAGSRKTALKMFQLSRQRIWQSVDDIAQGTPISTNPFVEFVNKGTRENRRHIQEALRLADVDLGMLQTKIPRQIGDPLQPGHPARIVNETSFRDAHEAVSRLKEVGRRKPTSLEDQGVVNTARKLATLLDESVENAARRLNPDALDAYKAAKAFTAEGYARYENALIRKAFKRLEAEPGALESIFFRAKRPDLLLKTREAVGTEAFQKLSERLAATVIERSKDSATGIVKGKAILDTVKSLGKETVEAMFPTTAKDIETLGKVLTFIEQRSTEKTGQVFMRLTQAGGAFQVITEPLKSLTTRTGQLAYTVLLGPQLMGRVLTSKTGIQWLTTGFRAGPGTEQFFRAMSQVAQSAARPESLKRPITLEEARQQGVRVRTDLERTQIPPFAASAAR